MQATTTSTLRHLSGFTLVELLVAMAIASFLIAGVVHVYGQSRQAYIVNDSIAQVQETAQFALDTIENDLRMASFWGRTGRALAIDGRAIPGNMNPYALPEPTLCGVGWALNIALPVDGQNNRYVLPCAPAPTAQANSDVITVRRASTSTVPVDAARLQIQTTRIHGKIFSGTTSPSEFSVAIEPETGLSASVTHNLLVSSYYVASDSGLVPGAPTLRRKRLGSRRGAPTIVDEEVAPGVENLQLRLGVDVDADNAVDRYVEPGGGVFDPTDTANYIPGATILTARVWLLVRSVSPEPGIVDSNHYQFGDVDLGRFDDRYRRMLISKTILLRNARY